MKKFFKLFVAIVLLGSLMLEYDDGQLQLTSAQAQTNGILTITFAPPTNYTDGFPLLEQELDFYTFYCGTWAFTFDSIIGTRSADIDVSSMPSGDYTCHLTVTGLPTGSNAFGAESGPSNTLDFTVGQRVPGSPALT